MTTRGLIAITAILLTLSASALAQSNIPAQILQGENERLCTHVGSSKEWKLSPSSEPTKVSGQWEARWVFDLLIEWRATQPCGLDHYIY